MTGVTTNSFWPLVSVVLQAEILYYFDSYFHGNFFIIMLKSVLSET